ncbi:MAG: anthranilate phosphoribosyltransferase [Planctomycetia bacterium]|nr:anthranilate phosphoribosyltransferase [Planctomycetia bacterium]
MIETQLGKLAAGENLSLEETSAAIDAVMQGQCTPGEIGLLLTGLRLKGETVAEIAGAARAMRKHMTPIRTSRADVLDTCGTGGDGSGTFNISTAAAIVAAAAGAAVAKHGNRSASGRTGSADVLAELGVNIEADAACVEDCLAKLGICFCYAPRLHSAMKHVAPVRKQLGFPTIFNLLGPLTNPAGAPFQLIGVGRAEAAPLLAEAIGLLGTRRSVIVHGEGGLDEVSLAGPTAVIEVTPQGRRAFAWRPEDFGLSCSGLSCPALTCSGTGELRVAGPAESAEVIRGVLAGRRGAARDVVVLNAAAALWTVGKAQAPAEAAALAAQAIDSGAARRLLTALAERTRA